MGFSYVICRRGRKPKAGFRLQLKDNGINELKLYSALTLDFLSKSKSEGEWKAESDMSDKEDHDSDAPEEFTSEQGIQQDEEIRKTLREGDARVAKKRKEKKEKRKQWAQKLASKPSKSDENFQDVSETEPQQGSNVGAGFLPDNIVQMLAARDKQVFLLDSDDEKAEVKPTSRKKKSKKSGLEPVILSEIGPPHCLQSSLDFLKKRKMGVSRSSAVLNNSNQALRLLSGSGVISRR